MSFREIQVSLNLSKSSDNEKYSKISLLVCTMRRYTEIHLLIIWKRFTVEVYKITDWMYRKVRIPQSP